MKPLGLNPGLPSAGHRVEVRGWLRLLMRQALRLCCNMQVCQIAPTMQLLPSGARLRGTYYRLAGLHRPGHALG